MFDNICRGVAALACVVVVAPADAEDTGSIAVAMQGFCVTKNGTRCEEVALPGSSIPYERLPKLPDGRRVIYFYSDQTLSPGTVFVHVLEAEDMDPDAHYAVAKGLGSRLPNLSDSLKAIGTKLGHGGALEITPFQAEGSQPKPLRVFSYIPVEGPGVFSAQVVDLAGNPAASSGRVSFSVTRGPDPGSSKTLPSRGLKPEDADG